MQKRTIVAAFALIVLFGLFIYPGLYIYQAVGTDSIRINRFTGVKEYSTDNGWRTSDQMLSDVKRENLAAFAKKLSSGRYDFVALTSGQEPPATLTLHAKDGATDSLMIDPADLTTYNRETLAHGVSWKVQRAGEFLDGATSGTGFTNSAVYK